MYGYLFILDTFCVSHGASSAEAVVSASLHYASQIL